MIVLALVVCGAFALSQISKSVGRKECGGRCWGCGKCGRGRKRASGERSDG